LGISKKVNDATFGLLAEKRVTSATLLANGPAIKDAVRWLGRFQDCSFGCHLKIIEFQPLCKAGAPLLTRGGDMSRKLVETSASNPKFMCAVYEEFCAQIARLLAWGVPISHLDSHQHVHTIPSLFPAFKAAQKRFGIRAIRSSRNIYSKTQPISRALQKKKIIYNWALRTIYKSHATDGMTDLPALLQMKPADVEPFHWIEIMTHPGAEGDSDNEILWSDWMGLLDFPARLASYHQLRDNKAS
jgi:predicted glycoside hydrolase/deacetylase ChbG (UPF0249 family)